MKHVLLAVVGLSPQVVTETLYALHQQGKEVNAIHLITTRAGKAAILASLLEPRGGHYFRYLDDYGIDRTAISFGPENIHVVRDQRGNEIADIATEEENSLLLRTCLDLAFRFTAEPETTVFFSIAGGRKTMSACMMVAAQLYARPHDRVHHVLVSPEFESSPVFFYPPRHPALIELRDANGHPFYKETRYAKVNLVPIPFVSVRDRIAGEMLREPREPAELMQSLIRDAPPLLTIDIPAKKVVFQGREIDMMPTRLALYAFFALIKKGCALHGAQDGCRDCTECFLTYQETAARQGDITDIYRKTAGRFISGQEMSATGILALDQANFNSYKRRIQQDLERGFCAVNAARLAIASVGKRPDTRYGIPQDRNDIRVIL